MAGSLILLLLVALWGLGFFAWPIGKYFHDAIAFARDDAHRVLPEPPFTIFLHRLNSVSARMVRIGWPIAFLIPTLLFGLVAFGPQNVLYSILVVLMPVALLMSLLLFTLAGAWWLAPRIDSSAKLSAALFGFGLGALVLATALPLILFPRQILSIQVTHSGGGAMVSSTIHIFYGWTLLFAVATWFWLRRRAHQSRGAWLRLPE